MMATGMRTQRNPVLETLRDDLLKIHAAPSVALIAHDLLDKTRRIHVGFLFDDRYGKCQTWHLLITKLCATPSHGRSIAADWKVFSHLLGFDRSWIQSIENIQPGREDPVTNTLRAFAQQPNATLNHIVKALVDMDREDIILLINQPLSDLVDGVLRQCDDQNLNDSGYLSRNSSDGEQDSIILPPFIPDVPCLLKDPSQLSSALPKVDTSLALGQTKGILDKLDSTDSREDESGQSSGCTDKEDACSSEPFDEPEEDLQNNSPSEEIYLEVQPRAGHRCIVMLTFASDGQDAANELALILRRPRQDSQGCGVVILQEQLALLNRDPTAFIEGCFQQVDYIIPILTVEYLKSIRVDAPVKKHSNCADADHARFIFRLMIAEFTNNNCMNKRVRSLIPDHLVKQIVRNTITLPIFHAFFKSSYAENFASKLLRHTI